MICVDDISLLCIEKAIKLQFIMLGTFTLHFYCLKSLCCVVCAHPSSCFCSLSALIESKINLTLCISLCLSEKGISERKENDHPP